MKQSILKSELEEALANALKAIRSHKGKRISIAKAFDLMIGSVTQRKVEIVHIAPRRARLH